MNNVTPIPVNLPDINSGMTQRDVIQQAILAALMHVKPDYRSARKLDECAGVITDFVEGALRDMNTPAAAQAM
jgi:hypothetical protein